MPPKRPTGWFDMFAQSPQLDEGPERGQLPQTGAGAPPAAMDPLSMFFSMLMNRGQQQPMIPQFNPVDLVTALRNDPYGDYAKLASLPSNAPNSMSPFATGYFQNPQLTPEATLASQGNTATNQWAQRGGVQGVNPEELRRLNTSRRGSY